MALAMMKMMHDQQLLKESDIPSYDELSSADFSKSSGLWDGSDNATTAEESILTLPEKPKSGKEPSKRSSGGDPNNKHAKLKKIKEAMNTLVTGEANTNTTNSKKQPPPSPELSPLSGLCRSEVPKKQPSNPDLRVAASRFSLGLVNSNSNSNSSLSTDNNNKKSKDVEIEIVVEKETSTRSSRPMRRTIQRNRSQSLTQLDRRKQKRRSERASVSSDNSSKPNSQPEPSAPPHFNFAEPRPRRRHSIGSSAATRETTKETEYTTTAGSSKRTERSSARKGSTKEYKRIDSDNNHRRSSDAAAAKKDSKRSSDSDNNNNKRSSVTTNTKPKDYKRSDSDNNKRSELVKRSDSARKVTTKPTKETKKEGGAPSKTSNKKEGEPPKSSKPKEGELRASKKDGELRASKKDGEALRASKKDGEPLRSSKKDVDQRGRRERRDKRKSDASNNKKPRSSSRSKRAHSSNKPRSRSLGAKPKRGHGRSRRLNDSESALRSSETNLRSSETNLRSSESNLRSSESALRTSNLRRSSRDSNPRGHSLSRADHINRGTSRDARGSSRNPLERANNQSTLRKSTSAGVPDRTPLKHRANKTGSYGSLLHTSPMPRKGKIVTGPPATTKVEKGLGESTTSLPVLGNIYSPDNPKKPDPVLQKRVNRLADAAATNPENFHSSFTSLISMTRGEMDFDSTTVANSIATNNSGERKPQQKPRSRSGRRHSLV